MIYSALNFYPMPTLPKLAPCDYIYGHELTENGADTSTVTMLRLLRRRIATSPLRDTNAPIYLDVEYTTDPRFRQDVRAKLSWETQAQCEASVRAGMEEIALLCDQAREVSPQRPVIPYTGPIIWDPINAARWAYSDNPYYARAHEDWKLANAFLLTIPRLRSAISGVYLPLFVMSASFMDDWELGSQKMCDEARGFGLPVHAQLCAHTHNGQPLPEPVLRRTLDVALAYADHVVLWGSGWGGNSNEPSWETANRGPVGTLVRLAQERIVEPPAPPEPPITHGA